MPLYETDDGRPISTHGMLDTMGRCPRKAMYKFVDRLKPKQVGVPLRKGTWMHHLLEAKYKGKSWRKVHKRLSRQYGELFEEERERLGDLPRECERLMRAYLWHYRDDADWKVLDVEMTIETDFPDGSLYRGRVDMLVETPFGLYVVDHKNNKTLPSVGFRLRDVQSVLYVWAARRCEIPVQGFIWNYLRTVDPKPIRFNLNGSVSKRQGEHDYLTAKQGLIDEGRDPRDYAEILQPLKRQRYVPGAPQTSPFFRRETLEKDDDMIARVLKEKTRTSRRAHEYDFADRDAVERVPDRSCDWMCAYKDLCTTELMGGNTHNILRHQFTVGDPMDYYQDAKERTD